jgi:anti-sigma factor RsiW
MMQQLSDEKLVAFLDGKISGEEFSAIEHDLEQNAGLRERLALLSEATLLVREAFDEVLHEPIPERLLAACRGEASVAEEKTGATILAFRQKAKPLSAGKSFARRAFASRNWWTGLAAASVAGIVFGASGVYLVGGDSGETQVASNGNWLDNIAGYHNLFVASATGAENTVFDVPAGAEKNSSIDIRVPDLKPWKLNFQGARKIVVDGKPAYQFFYTTDKKEVGPVTLFVTTSSRPDMQPTFDRRDGVNMLYWRKSGHGFAIVGQANKNFMSGLANDIAWQLKGI